MLLDLLFPKFCVGCHHLGLYFCPQCFAKIKWVQHQICPVCGKTALFGQTHPFCRKKTKLDGLISATNYSFPMRQAVKVFKFSFVSNLGDTLAQIVLSKVEKKSLSDFTLSSVPLYIKRENWRGFNQSEILAQKLAQKLELPYAEVLKRERETKPQANLDSKERIKNVQGVFTSLVSPQGKKILLVDDVWTTGSTLNECARVLKKNGAEKVWALTVCR